MLCLGLSGYQSRPNVSGGVFTTALLDNDIGGPSSSNVDVTYDLPDIIRWGARYRPARDVELRALRRLHALLRVFASMRGGQREPFARSPGDDGAAPPGPRFF